MLVASKNRSPIFVFISNNFKFISPRKQYINSWL